MQANPGYPCWISNEIKAKNAVLLLFRQLPNVGLSNFDMWDVYNLAKTDSTL